MNLNQKARDEIALLLNRACAAAAEKNLLPAVMDIASTIEVPREVSFGDFSSNYALAAARAMHMPPRKIADAIAANIDMTNSYFASVETAGAGFLNFRLGAKWYAEVLKVIASEGADFARTKTEHPEKVMVEFVSANPTGPMHMGNARGGVLGDCLAEVLSFAGNDVYREFLVNDAGNQVMLMGVSLDARYLQTFPETADFPFPDDGYHGEDVREIAAAFKAEFGDLRDLPVEERREKLMRYGLARNIAAMHRDLERYKITYDRWFHETELHNAGFVEDTVKLLTEKGLTYEKDDALWFKTTEFGCGKDDVLRKGNGFYSYFAVDIAYHRDKFLVRGFDRVINVWGADHHGQVARLKAAMQAIGVDPERLEIVLMQLVNLMRDGEVVRMSKRTGKAVSLSDLLDEISVDAARFFFNLRKFDTKLDFDLDLAVRSDADNPVYYVQYAHARICSLLANLAEAGITPSDDADLSCLTASEETALIKLLASLPDELLLAARERDPSRVNKYLVTAAAAFHRFYNACRIKGAGAPYEQARACLAARTRDIIASGLSIIRVDAPVHM
ncbi:MAG: arginine--tRNA ligase [Clostridiaceae bacterium]|nr:arginine--tRNA ligase [Clostridiaceae bacterium]